MVKLQLLPRQKPYRGAVDMHRAFQPTSDYVPAVYMYSTDNWKLVTMFTLFGNAKKSDFGPGSQK